MRFVAATLFCLLALQTSAQRELVLHIEADHQIVQPGESVNYTIWAELLNPEYEVLAVIADICFALDFGGTDLVLSDNTFQPAFTSDFFGPPNDGTVNGDSIGHAFGSNTLPPLNNSDGPDSSNPMLVYTFVATVPENPAFSTYTPSMGLYNESRGALVGTPFPIILNYSHRGQQPDTPYRVEADTIYVPTPSVSLVFVYTGLTASRRRR
ncbi:MAG: hypothetical protein Phyf2KO_13710 [Phycisphaerales bacterium]